MKFNSIFCVILTSFKISSCLPSNIILSGVKIQEKSEFHMKYSLSCNKNEFTPYNLLTQFIENLTLIWTQNDFFSIEYSKDTVKIVKMCKKTHGKASFGKKRSAKLMFTCSINEILKAKYGCDIDVQYFVKIFIIKFYRDQQSLFHVLPQNMTAFFMFSDNTSFINEMDCYLIIQRMCKNNKEKPFFRSIYFVIGLFLMVFITIYLLDIVKSLEEIVIKIKETNRAKVSPALSTIS